MHSSFWVSQALFPSAVSENRLTYNGNAVAGCQRDHIEKCISFSKMVSGLCLPGMSSLNHQEAISGPNSLEDQKCFLKFCRLLPSWLLIHHVSQMDGRWKLLQSECYCSRGFFEMSWGIQPNSEWKCVSSAIDTWAVNLSCQWLQWILLYGVFSAVKKGKKMLQHRWSVYRNLQFAQSLNSLFQIRTQIINISIWIVFLVVCRTETQCTICFLQQTERTKPLYHKSLLKYATIIPEPLI